MSGSNDEAVASDRGPVIWLIGPFPPPLHGQAVFNAALAPHLRRHGRLRVLGTGAGIAGKLASCARIVAAALFRMRRADVVYLSMPGRSSAWLFVAVTAAVRLRRLRHYIHHHSFRPIVRGPLRAMRLIVWLGGGRQHHILLSAAMRARFAGMYLGRRGGDRAHVLSNALLFCPAAPVTPRPHRPPTIGHLSVLTREKGVDLLLDAFRRAAERIPDLRLVIAGPVADAGLRDEILAAATALPGRIDYRGPVDGEAKRRFWTDIDLFALPSRLVDEAEPLVMLESYAAGVDFMGTDQGCIPERLRRPDRLLAGAAAEDADRIVTALQDGAVDWAALRTACVGHAAVLRAGAQAEAAQLFVQMLAP